jgi:hypothetical protein
MGRAIVSAIHGLVTLAVSSCTTEACDCPPALLWQRMTEVSAWR